MISRRTILALIVGTALVAGSVPAVARAESIVEQIGCDVTTIVNGTVTVNHACQITDFINLFIYLAKWGMSVLAFLAVGTLVYGGIQFITAGGRASKVDEGKRVIAGTVIGVIISLTAYVIINTSVTAITGSTLKVKSNNFFGVVGSVFSKVKTDRIQDQTVPIERPFSDSTSSSSGGTGGQTGTLAACRTSADWNQSCTVGSGSALELFCADAANSVVITGLQTALNDKGCTCGSADGCFGAGTATCVRQFQIANGLPATGTIDQTTKNKIDNGGVNCTAAANAVAAALPAIQERKPTSAGTGCCIVGSGTTDYYCLDKVSAQACTGLGSDSDFFPTSESCTAYSASKNRCGFCTNSFPPTTADAQNHCANNTTAYWCTSVIQNTRTPNTTPTFVANSSCNGACASCSQTIVNSL